VYQNSRFAQVARTMLTWGDEAPALPGFRELLWSVEQIESSGSLYSAHVALTYLRAIVPAADVRAGYAWAQSGRVYRTLGLVRPSQAAFEVAIDTATQHGDVWLRARSQLGLGALLHGRGAYPAANALFRQALECAREYPELQIGAHLGLVSVAKAVEEYDDALSHGWEALRLASGEVEAEVEALAVLSSLSLDVGEYVAARNTSVRALALSPRLPIRQPLVRTVVQAAVALGDTDLIDRYFPELVQIAHGSANPWEQSHALRVSAEVHHKRQRHDVAVSLLERSRGIARNHGFAELEWLAEETMVRLNDADGAQPLRSSGAARLVRLNRLSSAVLMELSRQPV
jgi:tetratricopeptide (TPR) repeat protein